MTITIDIYDEFLCILEDLYKDVNGKDDIKSNHTQFDYEMCRNV